MRGRCGGKYGVPGRIRTRDPLLRRQPLYPLSYRDMPTLRNSVYQRRALESILTDAVLALVIPAKAGIQTVSDKVLPEIRHESQSTNAERSQRIPSPFTGLQG